MRLRLRQLECKAAGAYANTQCAGAPHATGECTQQLQQLTELEGAKKVPWKPPPAFSSFLAAEDCANIEEAGSRGVFKYEGCYRCCIQQLLDSTGEGHQPCADSGTTRRAGMQSGSAS